MWRWYPVAAVTTESLSEHLLSICPISATLGVQDKNTQKPMTQCLTPGEPGSSSEDKHCNALWYTGWFKFSQSILESSGADSRKTLRMKYDTVFLLEVSIQEMLSKMKNN